MLNCGIVTVLYNHNEDQVYNWFRTLIHNFFYLPLFNFSIYLINNGKKHYSFNEFNRDEIVFNSLVNNSTSQYFIHYIEMTENTGYCGGNNKILDYLSRDDIQVLYVINPDVYINDSLVFDWMFTLSTQKNSITGVLQNGKDWLVYPAMFPTDRKYTVDELPFAYDYNPVDKYPNQKWKSLTYIDGSLMCIPYKLFYDLNGFDTDFHPGYFGETAFQFRAHIEQDVALINCPIQKMIQHRSESDSQYGIDQKKEWTSVSRRIFYEKYALPNYEKFLSILV